MRSRYTFLAAGRRVTPVARRPVARIRPRPAAGWCVVLLLLGSAGGAARADDAAPAASEESLFNPTPAGQMRAFSTDRPPKANSPYTVDAGHFQVETDLAVLAHGTTAGTTTRQTTLVDPTLKLGLTHAVDAELQLTPFEAVTNEGAGPATRFAGIGDTVARLKVNVLGNDRGDVAVALLPYVKIPTARSGLGNGKFEGGLILPVSVAAPAGFTVVVMPEVDASRNAAGSGDHAVFDLLVNVSHPLTARLSFYTEAYASRSAQAGSARVYTLDEALTYALAPNLQLDLGGNFSLNAVAPRTQLYLGISERF